MYPSTIGDVGLDSDLSGTRYDVVGAGGHR